MANTPKIYAFCDANCRWETMTREQIIAAIAEATGVTVTNVDEAFITMLKEQNNGEAVRFWVGTQAEYNTLVEAGNVEDGVIYLTEDGSKLSILEKAVNENAERIANHEYTIGIHEITLNDHDRTLENHEGRIKAAENASSGFASHKHSTSDITSGVFPIERGGTGANTQAEALNKLGAAAKNHSHSLKDLGLNFASQSVRLLEDGTKTITFEAKGMEATGGCGVFVQLQNCRDEDGYTSEELAKEIGYRVTQLTDEFTVKIYSNSKFYRYFVNVNVMWVIL